MVDASVEGLEGGEAEQREREEEARPPRKVPSAQLPAMGKAQPWVNNTTWLEYFSENYNGKPNDDGFYAVVNYLNFGVDTRLKKGDFRFLSISTRLDGQMLPMGTEALCDFNNDAEVSPQEAAVCAYDNDARVERVLLRLEHKRFNLFVGDFNVNFGRGVALSVRKKSNIGVDSTIKGARLDIKTKPLKLTGLFGVGNRQQSDSATRQLFQDPGYVHALCEDLDPLVANEYGNRLWTMCSDMIGAVRAEAKLPGKVKLAAHYGNMWFGLLNEATDQHEALHFVGGDLSRARIFGKWSFFGGATAILRNYHHKENHPELVEDGLGAYVSNNISLGNLNLLIEGKYYDNYVLSRDTAPLTVQYTEAPTLEREDQQVPAAANAAGPLLRIAYTFPKKGITLYSNTLGYAFAYNNDDDMWYGQDAMRVLHAFVGMDWDDTERGTSFKLVGGWRWEGHYEPQPEGTERFDRKLPHAEIYLNQALKNVHWGRFQHSVNFKFDWRRETVFKTDHAKHFHKGNLLLGYGLSPYVAVSFIGGYSSEFTPPDDAISLHDQPCPDGGTDCGRKPHLWPGAEIRYNFLSSSFIRVFAGRQVGGLLCANGSCRELPDFSGARADLVLSF